MTSASSGVIGDGTDDDATDNSLFSESVTWSKGRLRRAKLMSMISGNKQPSRKEIFCRETSEDRRIWNICVHGKTIHCAKISNPSILVNRNNSNHERVLEELTDIHRLEIEDPEGVLRTVPKPLVARLSRLESLSMTWTKISSLPSGLYHLPLNSLYLQRNQIKSLDGIERAESLTILDVSNNQISSLPKMFGQLVNLVTVNLSCNELRELPDSIGLLIHMRTLDASHNRIRTVPESISGAFELTSLDLCSNQITSLPESLANLPNLEDLRLRSNQLRSLPSSFGQLRRLSSLMLRANRFIDVPEQLSELGNLANLNMRENNIVTMRRPIASLRCLVLDNNELTRLDEGILGCSNLQLLSVQHNKITELSDESICRLRALRSLHLAENDIVRLPVGLGRLEHLRHLNVKATLIDQLPLPIVTMRSLTTLEIEDCSKLDEYLKLAHRQNGLPGVVQYLKEQHAANDQTSANLDVSPPTSTTVVASKPLVDRMKKPPEDTASTTGGASKLLVDRTKMAHGDSTSTMSESSAVDRRPKTTPANVRQAAGLSIVPGTTVEPPVAEAMVQVGTRNQVVHIARYSICPPTVAPKPKKPSVQPNSVQPVIETLEEFGDLKSASCTE